MLDPPPDRLVNLDRKTIILHANSLFLISCIMTLRLAKFEDDLQLLMHKHA